MGDLMIGAIDRLNVLRNRWKSLPLTGKFILGGGFFTLVSMLLFGILTTTNLTQIALQPRASVSSAIAQHILAPAVQNLDADGRLEPASLTILDDLIADPIFASEFPYLDIWLPDGRILYSNTSGLAGRNLPAPQPVLRAFQGEPSVNFTDVDSADFAEHDFKTDFIETYVPLRKNGGDEVLAVAQMRGLTTSLESDLWSLTLSSWISVAAMSLVVILGIFGIVLEGSRTIDRQARVLSKRLALSHARAVRLRELRAAAQLAYRSIAGLTDKHLRTIGTDLHDGPAQSISLAVLKLDRIRRQSGVAQRTAVVSEIETILGDALGEIRTIALALVLPDIEHLDLAQVIGHAIELHMRRINITIAVDNRVEPAHVDSEIAVCVFRFLQEGLNNAFHHGLPEGQTVSAVILAGVLKLSITNKYIAGASSDHADHSGIGLYGLRARVEGVGGKLMFIQSNGETRLEMWLRCG
jgi:signal transduction histidine kinase